jgi:signal transduction histidine kinase
MKKSIWIFLLAVLLPGVVLGWLALRSAGEQQIIFERRTAELYQKETEDLAAAVRETVEAERRAFSDVVHRLLGKSDAEALARDFTNTLTDAWPRHAVGFAIGPDGQMLSPSAALAAKDTGCRDFLWNNGSFLCSTQPAIVYPVPVASVSKSVTYSNQLRQRAQALNELGPNPAPNVQFLQQEMPVVEAESRPALVLGKDGGDLVLAQKPGAPADRGAPEHYVKQLLPAKPQTAMPAPVFRERGEGSVASDAAALATVADREPEARMKQVASVEGAGRRLLADDVAKKAEGGAELLVKSRSLQGEGRQATVLDKGAAGREDAAPSPQTVSAVPAAKPRPPPKAPSSAPMAVAGPPARPGDPAGVPMPADVATRDGSIAAKGGTPGGLQDPKPVESFVPAAAPPEAVAPRGAAAVVALAQPDGATSSESIAGVSGLGTSGELKSDRKVANAVNSRQSADKGLEGDLAAIGRGMAGGAAPLPMAADESRAAGSQSAGGSNAAGALNFNGTLLFNRQVEPVQNLRPQTVNWSAVVPANAEFRTLTANADEGMVSRFVQDKLGLIFWIRPPEAPEIVFGCLIEAASLQDLWAGVLGNSREPDTRAGKPGFALALLDDKARPVSTFPQGGAAREWKRPFVASEIGEALPHWETALYLATPTALADSARGFRRTLSFTIVAAVALIALGGWLVVADVRRHLALAQKKTDFVSNVSHELKTPLTSIRMFAELMHDRPPPAEKQGQYLRIITAEAERLTRLINNVLDFAKLERRQKHFEKKRLDLHAVISRVWEGHEMHLRDLGFATKWDGAPGPYPVTGDEDALSQILVNLLSNAEKYSGEWREVELATSITDGCVNVSIQDRGIGVPVGEEKKIFESFYRAHDSLSSGIQGSGLGLTLAQRLAREHGGEILFERRTDGGSRFTLRLPVDPAGS